MMDRVRALDASQQKYGTPQPQREEGNDLDMCIFFWILYVILMWIWMDILSSDKKLFESVSSNANW